MGSPRSSSCSERVETGRPSDLLSSAPMLPAPDLANAVTSFCTIGAGVTAMVLSRLVEPRQPPRWMGVWFCLFLTGLPTLGWHGWGVVATDWTGEAWRIADVGTNLLLAFAIQLAVAGDFYGTRFRNRLALLSGVANLVAVAGLVREGVTGVKSYAIPLGDFGGFYPGEAMLIADAFLVTGLFYAARERIAPAAKPLLHAVTAIFVVGLGLATAEGSVVVGQVGSLHALWHVVGGFGFVFLWAFTQVRLAHDTRSEDSR